MRRYSGAFVYVCIIYFWSLDIVFILCLVPDKSNRTRKSMRSPFFSFFSCFLFFFFSVIVVVDVTNDLLLLCSFVFFSLREKKKTTTIWMAKTISFRSKCIEESDEWLVWFESAILSGDCYFHQKKKCTNTHSIKRRNTDRKLDATKSRLFTSINS